MATEIYLVKVGMTMTEGMVEEWYVPDGGTVEKGALLYRLETEKVNLDVDADASGTVKHGVGVGVSMQPGDVIGHIYAPGEAIPSTAPSASAAAAPVAIAAVASRPALVASTPAPIASGGRLLSSPAARRLAGEMNVDIASVRGTGPGGRIVEADVRAAAAAPAATSAPAAAAGPASPLAKRLAAELGVDLARVTGTGPGGRITKEDVERAAATPPAAPAPVAAKPAPSTPAGGQRVPVKGIRKTIATRMHESLRNSAQLTMNMDVNMDDAVKLRTQLISEWESQNVRPTYTDLS